MPRASQTPVVRRRAKRGACYPNSGAFAGRPATLLRALKEMRRIARDGEGVEQDDDQAGANRLCARPTRARHQRATSAPHLARHLARHRRSTAAAPHTRPQAPLRLS